MQTFLPYSSFAQSASALDWRRLGKQRVEAKQILLALSDSSYGWQNHPAVKMWRGHEAALAEYGWTICEEWTRRGYRDTLTPWFWHRFNLSNPAPSWLGREDFHRAHQSNLLRKAPEYYRAQFPGVPDNLPYIWPEA